MAEKQLTHSEHGAFVAPEGLGPQGQSNLGKAIRTWRMSLKGRFIGFTAEDEVTFTYSLQTVEVAIGWQTSKNNGSKTQDDAKEWNKHKGEAAWNRSRPPSFRKAHVRFPKASSSHSPPCTEWT